MERTTDARPGSAWDTWHKGGWDHASSGGPTSGVELDVAANSYAVGRGFPGPTCRRAFKDGVRNYLQKEKE